MIHLDSEFIDRRSIDRATNRTLLYKRKMEGLLLFWYRSSMKRKNTSVRKTFDVANGRGYRQWRENFIKTLSFWTVSNYLSHSCARYLFFACVSIRRWFSVGWASTSVLKFHSYIRLYTFNRLRNIYGLQKFVFNLIEKRKCSYWQNITASKIFQCVFW